MPNRHSLFWKLAVLLIGFSLAVIALTLFSGRLVGELTSYLSSESRSVLRSYAREAEASWQKHGAAGVDAFQDQLHEREGVWSLVLDRNLFPLGNRPVAEEQRTKLSFMRKLNWPMGRQSAEPRVLSIPFKDGRGQLVMPLPERFSPWGPRPLLYFIFQKLVPGVLALLFGIVLYRFFIGPLSRLREQANALSADDLNSRVGKPITARRDELGELGRAFDHMAERLQGTVHYQRRLLSDLSHELRTPLSRLRVASEREDDLPALRVRLEREIELMQRLVENTLELAWLDSERPRLVLEPINVRSLWGLLCEDACFETGWPVTQLRFELEDTCMVLANLNGLAQALENVLRNAIRYSPREGVITLSGHREGNAQWLCLRDQGPGVSEDQLGLIFEPFSRLDQARPGDGGFGLGLSIARSSIELQGGSIWAQNMQPGLAVHLRLKAWPENPD
ncbi:histidine kinase sensor domain-containing protein [Aquipseudomonas campi]